MRNLTEKENMALVLAGKIPEWIPSFLDAAGLARPIAMGRHRDPKTGLNIDAFGVEFETTLDGDVPAYSKTGRFRLEDVTKWRNVMPQVNLDWIDWDAEASEIRAKIVREGRMCSLTAGWIFEELHYMMGTEGVFESMILEPEACYECMSAITDFWIAVFRRLAEHLKPELVVLMDHVATQSGMMLSAKMYRELIAPHNKRFFAAVRETGAAAQIHCDGLIEAILPDYAEMGVQMIQPFQIYNDINAAKEKYGFIAVGGWDSFGRGNQRDSTEEEIRASVRTAMDTYGPGGRYVFWQSGVTPAFRRNQEILADEARKYGRLFYGG